MTEENLDHLPSIVKEFALKHPVVWEAYNHLGAAAAEAGPLDARTERLVKLAIAIGAGLQGAVHAHVRRASAAGLKGEELQHVALLAITTIGWPKALAAYSWISEELEKKFPLTRVM
jgi:alkylhydroperoxidase/carboxymuconolactone decarboxylase family protein YurZ